VLTREFAEDAPVRGNDHAVHPWRHAATVATVLNASACAAAGMLISTDAWSTWLAHPAVSAAITRQGAELARAMLVVLAAMIVLTWVLLARLARQRGSHAFAPSSTLSSSQAARWAMKPTQRWTVAGLAGLALVLRLTRINESLWYDEIASWMVYNAGVNGAGGIVGSFLDPINHVLHTLLNRWSTSESIVGAVGMEPAFRLPALAFSVMTVPTMFALGRAAMGERAGMIAAGAAALAPVCVLEGVEARGYSQMIFFSAAATWLLIEAWCRPHAPWLWMVYALACALGVWSQFVTAWVAIGHGAWLTWRLFVHRDDRRKCAAGLTAVGLAGVASLTLYAPMIPGMLAWRANFLAQRGDEPRIFGPEGWHALLQVGGAWYWWAALAGLAVGGIGVVCMLRRGQRRVGVEIAPGDALALALLGLPLMVLAVAVSGSWLYARFMLFAVPGGLLVMVMGVEALWRWRRDAGIAAIVVISSGWIIDLAVRPPKQPVREAMTFINARAGVGDGVLEIGVAHQIAAIYADPDKRLVLRSSYFHGEDLAGKLDAGVPRWVVVEYPGKVPGERYALLRKRGYVEAARFAGWADWKHGHVLVFERRDLAR
jgi:hypothetical protein